MRSSRDPMRRVHLVSGCLMVAAFVASGAYMRWGTDVHALGPGSQLMFISRHIYMLGPALVHLVLAVYVRPVADARVPRLQWAGTIFLVVSSLLLVLAFVVEPMAGRGRTDVSALGIFSFWAGAILHVIAPSIGRLRRSKIERS